MGTFEPVIIDGLVKNAENAFSSGSDELVQIYLQTIITEMDNNKALTTIIRYGNVNLLKELLKMRPEISYDLTKILAKSYEELKVKKVLIRPEMEIFLQMQLLQNRLFAENEGTEAEQKCDIASIKERIDFLIELLEKLNENLPMEELLTTVKFIAININTLKKYLPATYAEIPWEELDFCGAIFLSNHLAFQTLSNSVEFVCQLLLDEERFKWHMKNFLGELKKFKPILNDHHLQVKHFQRNDVIKSLRENYRHYDDLKDDFEIMRNIYSLNRMLFYLKCAADTDFSINKQLSATLCQRAMQVVGECLKNGAQNPNLTSNIEREIKIAGSDKTKKILLDLRNDLSHVYALEKRMRLETNKPIEYFMELQEDLKYLIPSITSVMATEKTNGIKRFLKRAIALPDEHLANNLNKGLTLIQSNPQSEFIKFPIFDEIEGLLLYCDKLKLTVKQQESMQAIRETMKSWESTRNIEMMNLNLMVALCDSALTASKYGCGNLKGLRQFCKSYLTISRSNEEPMLKLLRNVIDFKVSLVDFKAAKEILAVIEELNSLIVLLNEYGKGKTVDHISWELQDNTIDRDILKSIGKEYLDRFLNVIESELMKKDIQAKIDLAIKRSDMKYGIVTNLKNDGFLDWEQIYVAGKDIDFPEDKVKKIVKSENLQKLESVMNRWTDPYGSYLKKLESQLKKPLLPEAKYVVVDELLVSVQVKMEKSEITEVIEKVVDQDRQQMQAYLESRITLFGELISLDETQLRTAAKIKVEKELAMEIILLDMVELLKLSSDFVAERNYLDSYCPQLVGRNARNYVAHGDTLVDVIMFEPACAVICNTVLLSRQINLTMGCKFGSWRKDNIPELRKRYEMNLNVRCQQRELFEAAESCETIQLWNCIELGNADCRGRDWAGFSILHYALRNFSFGENIFVNLLVAPFLPTHAEDVIFLSQNEEAVYRFLISEHKKNIGRNFRAVTNDNEAEIQFAFFVDEFLAATNREEQKKLLLLLAAFKGGVDVLEQLQKYGPVNINFLLHNTSPLHLAALHGREEFTKKLLEMGANVEIATAQNYSPLNAACNYGHLEIMELLWAKGARLDLLNSNGFSPLHFVCMQGFTKIAKFLIERNVPLETGSLMPIFLATQNGNLEIVKLLLAKNVAATFSSLLGSTVLHIAARYCHLDIVKFLIQSKPHLINAKTSTGDTPLFMAVEEGDMEVVTCLVENDAAVDVVNTDGVTPLTKAAKNGHLSVVKYLVENGATIDVIDSEQSTPLMWAVHEGHLEVARYLLKQRSNINIKMKNSRTPLHVACNNNFVEIVKMLIENGANLNVLDDNGNTPLRFAVMSGHLDIVKILVTKGAKLFVPDSDLPALHAAAISGQTDIVKYLIENKADVNEMYLPSKVTPLHSAAMQGHSDTVLLFLRKGANVNATFGESENITPLMIAMAMNYHKTVDVLKAHGATVDPKNIPGNYHPNTVGTHKNMRNIFFKNLF